MSSIEWLLIGILAIEILRLIQSIFQEVHVRAMNRVVGQRQKEWQEMCETRDREMEEIRKQEFEALIECSKSAAFLQDFVNDLRSPKEPL